MIFFKRVFRFAVFALLVVNGCGNFCGNALGADELLPVLEEIRREALLPNESELGRPLPLAAHWNSGQAKGGFSPVYQMEMIKRGHFLLPWFALPGPSDEDYYEAPMKWAAERGLPISFLSTQWESYLTSLTEYFSLPPDRNPNVVNRNGAVEKKVSPFGPVDLWKEVGRKWGSLPVLRKIQGWYPSPPLVLFISNNEQVKLG